MTAPRTVKVLVVDDHAGIRNALTRLIDSEQPQLWCVGSAATGAQALAMAREKQPDVILLDVVLGDEDGLALIAPLHRAAEVAIVVLTSLVDPRVAARAQRLGAVECINKSAPAADLLVCISRSGAKYTLPASTPP
jgi:two-component system nitrate/nitrite response regulator NarL